MTADTVEGDEADLDAGFDAGPVVTAATTLAGLVVAVGSLLTWSEIDSVLSPVTTTGTDTGAGVATLALGLLAAALTVAAFFGNFRPLLFGTVAIGIIVLVIAGMEANDVVDQAEVAPDGPDVSIGLGLWLTRIGGAGLAVGGVVDYFLE